MGTGDFDKKLHKKKISSKTRATNPGQHSSSRNGYQRHRKDGMHQSGCDEPERPGLNATLPRGIFMTASTNRHEYPRARDAESPHHRW